MVHIVPLLCICDWDWQTRTDVPVLPALAGITAVSFILTIELYGNGAHIIWKQESGCMYSGVIRTPT